MKILQTIFFCGMLTATPTLLAQNTKMHSVKQGESWQSIATKYNVSVEDLKEANKGNGGQFFTGIVLNIPENAVNISNASQSPATVAPLGDDIIAMTDGSYVTGTVGLIGTVNVQVRQEGNSTLFRIPIKEIATISYANGKIRTFNKGNRK